MTTPLKPNQIFVFGSNKDGFHGAGSAGFAMRGDSKNTWRNDSNFLKAMKSPKGSPDRIGKYAIYGVARGYQKGREGASYAIETIVRPGLRRSTPLSEIKKQLVDLLQFANSHPEKEVIMTPVGCGYSGYTAQEMGKIWEEAINSEKLPKNITLPKGLYQGDPDVSIT